MTTPTATNFPSPLRIAFAVDDVRPEPGFGLKDDLPMRHLLALADEFGCRFTLFVPTNWHGRFPLRDHASWVRWLLSRDEFEIAAHGDLHLAKTPSLHGSQEFLELSAEECAERFLRILSTWEQFGYRPEGFRWPGWGAREELYPVLDKHFRYVADHPQINRLARPVRIPRIHYTHSIEAFGFGGEESLILHSHIAGRGHTNNWTDERFESLRAFLRQLSENMTLEHVHLRDLVPQASLRECEISGGSCEPVVKLSDNTHAHQIDRVGNPITATHIDRYAIAAHWARGARVLDAACGYGYGSVILHALGAQTVVGVDRDPQAIAYAREHFESQHLVFRHSDVLSLPFPEKTFDHAVSIETFEHVLMDDALRLLHELRRVVRPQGHIVVTTPRRKTSRWEYHGGTHLYEYSPGEFLDTLHREFSRVDLLGIREHVLPSGRQVASDLVETLDEATVLLAVGHVD